MKECTCGAQQQEGPVVCANDCAYWEQLDEAHRVYFEEQENALIQRYLDEVMHCLLCNHELIGHYCYNVVCHDFNPGIDIELMREFKEITWYYDG